MTPEESIPYYKLYYKAHRESLLARQKAYYAKNKDLIKLKQATNDKYGSYQEQYREEHKVQMAEYQREYWKKNKDKLMEYRRGYKKKWSERKKLRKGPTNSKDSG